MVLISKVIEPVQAFDPFNPILSAGQSRPDIIQQACTHHTMTGLISQLAALTEFAGTVFANVAEQATNTYRRMQNLSERLEALTVTEANLETHVKSQTVRELLSNPGSGFQAEPAASVQLFTKTSMQHNMLQIYSQAKPPPNLAALDPYMEPGQRALALYTNPDFFLEEWIAAQLKEREEAKRLRRERRQQRKENAKKNPAKDITAVVEVAKMQRAVYDPLTGQKIMVTEASSHPVNRGTLRPLESQGSYQQQQLQAQASFQQLQIQQQSPSRQPSMTQQASFTREAPLPPPQQRSPVPPPVNDYLLPPPADDLPPPPPDFDMELPPPPPPAVFAPQQQRAPPLPPPQMARQPSAYGDATQRTPPPPPPPAAFSAPAPPPPPGAPAPPPPPPPPPSEFGGGVRPGGLLSAISGAKLKSSTSETMQKPKPVDARSSLLEGIRAGHNLKKVATNQHQVKKNDNVPLSVADILARRIAMTGDSDDSSDDDGDNDDWD
eukprot:TRINITY_DN11728_c0_g1_i1.p1 TRINITY_DN11728_c0_g1~~TRINITY_DN11728_c0_g1_i1.p1  ORF type:complete len:529 (+),score=176.53 TRINITY_DN11728_c0_g1_i1:106-1587(+)